MKDELSSKEIISVSETLSKLEPGILPKTIFIQIARLMTTCTVVLIPIIKEEEQFRILLTKRNPDDPYYSNLFHPPGTILRANDENIDEAFQRLYDDELKDPAIKRKPVFVNYVFDKIVRGREVSLIHWVELTTKPKVGELFTVNNLPLDIIKNDIPRIKMAVKHYKNTHNL